MIRKGTLRKAVELNRRADGADKRGKELAASQCHVKTLRDPTLDSLLSAFESESSTATCCGGSAAAGKLTW